MSQYLLDKGRTADVDDLITNALGAVLGWLVVLALGRFVATRAIR